jgi:hypothetical protein
VEIKFFTPLELHFLHLDFFNVKSQDSVTNNITREQK